MATSGSLLVIIRRFFPLILLFGSLQSAEFNIRDHGARGDGKAVDSPAINAAIQAAAASGGGIVRLPAGRYLSFSIRLQSHVALVFEPGAVLVAANPSSGLGTYDEAEANRHDQYQDFGHSHWHNSLLWGENIEDVSLTGPGLIDGTQGLIRHGQPPRKEGQATSQPDPNGKDAPHFPSTVGQGNKAIALKLCHNVTIRDLAVLNAGHFALLATGVDNLTLDNLRVDTNRDGFDIDACRNVRISNCSVNTPNDDAIVLKTSYALGFLRDCENITISNCFVSGYDAGSLLDSGFRRTQTLAPDRDGVTGRIKIGTESNGSFRNITISNCIFEHCRGLALESVDGGVIEDVSITNLTMRDIVNSPLFIRLGNRARGPKGTPVGAIRRITISNIVASGADARYASIIAGIPGHPVEDVRLSGIHLLYKGGLSMKEAAEQPSTLTNAFFQRAHPPESGQRKAAPLSSLPSSSPREPYEIPERETGYPEPSMFGILPAYGLFMRHVANISVQEITLDTVETDSRPAVVLMDVSGASFEGLRAKRADASPSFVLREVRDFRADRCHQIPNTQINEALSSQIP